MKRMMTYMLALSFSSLTFSQIDVATTDSLKHYESPAVPIYDKEYMRKYKRAKYLVQRVYPYALHAADVLDEIDNNAEGLEKRRKRKKMYRESYKDLKDDFKYVILNMYTSEGHMLMKLIYRETGMTVYNIAAKYRGRDNAEIFALMGKLWDQDIKSVYSPTGEDKITEHVIMDIENGSVPFDDNVNLITKEEHKIEKEEYKELKKRSHQRAKEIRNKQKDREKEKKKAARKSE